MNVWLQEKNLYRGEEGNEMRLGICSRSKDVIEPLLKPQWWVNCKGMASRGCDAVRNGELEILPNSMEAAWFRYVAPDARDWKENVSSFRNFDGAVGWKTSRIGASLASFGGAIASPRTISSLREKMKASREQVRPLPVLLSST